MVCVYVCSPHPLAQFLSQVEAFLLIWGKWKSWREWPRTSLKTWIHTHLSSPRLPQVHTHTHRGLAFHQNVLHYSFLHYAKHLWKCSQSSFWNKPCLVALQLFCSLQWICRIIKLCVLYQTKVLKKREEKKELLNKSIKWFLLNTILVIASKLTRRNGLNLWEIAVFVNKLVCTSLVSEVCGKCGEALSRTQPAVRAMDKLFHSNCFCCMSCHRPLQGMQFYDRDGAPQCEDCYMVRRLKDLTKD